MRHRPWLLLALGLPAIAPAVAHADVVQNAERGSEIELTHAQVTGSFVDGTVHWQVRYQVANRGRVADHVQLQLELPGGGTVTGLRTRVGGELIPGRLLARDAAQDRFDAYVDTPFTAARGAALLTADGPYAELALSFVPAHGAVGVEYDVVAPACFAHGAWIASVPTGSSQPATTARRGRLTAVSDLRKAWGEAPDAACEGSGAMIGGDDDRVAVWPGLATGVAATVASVAAGATTVRDVEIAVAPVLEPAPRHPAVVFVIDASRSQGVDGIADQLAIVHGYLAHARDARVELIVVRREATRLFGRLVPAAQVDDLVAARAAALAPGNGSHLDRGLALAAAVLAAATGPRRLVAFTDDRLRPSLTDAALHAALAPLPIDAVAHVALPHGGDAPVSADREHHLVDVIDGWGGIVASVGAAGDPAPLEELVRPLRLEDVALGDDVIADELREGQGLRQLSIGAAPPPVTAWIWGRRLTATTRATQVDRIRVARLALGTGVELDDAAGRILAGLAGVATRFTAFLADRPSWIPGGLPDDDLGISGGSSWDSMCGMPSGLSGYGTIGHGTGTGTADDRPRPDVAPLLAARIAGCLATDRGARVHVDVTTTGVEVVDVAAAATGAADAGSAARIEACAVEAGWALDLDASFARYTTTFAADFGG